MSARVNPFFTPTQISGCQLWLDAADPSSLSLSGASLSQIRDKSGNAYNATQATLASQPTWSSNRITFSNNTYLDFPQAAINNTTTYALFLVFNPIASVNWIIQKQYNGVGSYNMLSMTNFWINNTGITNYLYWNAWPNTYSPINSGTALQLNTVQLVEVTYNGTTLNMFQNGNLLSSATGTYTIQNQLSATNCTIGSWRPDGGIQNSGVTNFQFGELIYYNTSVTTQQRQQIEGYLAWKWGLQSSLPANHPYKNSPIAPLGNPPTTPAALLQNTTPTWIPTQISGCSLWLDAADRNTLVFSGSNVSQWNDKSGNARNAITQGTGPTYSTQTNSLVFTGAQNMRGSANYLHNSSDGTWSVFAIALTNNIVSANLILNYDVTPNRVAQFLRPIGPSDIESISFESGGAVISSRTSGLSLNTRFLGEAVNTTNSLTSFLNARQGSTSSHGTNVTVANTFYSVGVYQEIGGGTGYIGQYWNGEISEIITYSNAVSVAQRQQVEGYLAWKWNLQANLPNTHPFKASPPFVPASAFPARSLAQTAGFNPLRISGCSLWLDAADASSLSLAGSNITEWRDKSGNARTATQYNTGFATYDSIQKRVVIIPQGQLSSPVPAGTFSAGLSAFVVFQKFGANLAYDALVSRTNDNGPFPAPFDAYYDGNQNRLIGEGGNNNRASFVNTATFFRNTTTTLYYFNIPAAVIWNEGVNGANPASILPQSVIVGTPTYSDTGIRIYIGTRGDRFTTANVYIYEILFYNTTLSTSQRQQVEGYLAWKWGLQGSLPANHPWKNWPPPP
jgi:hypothetical protein